MRITVFGQGNTPDPGHPENPQHEVEVALVRADQVFHGLVDAYGVCKRRGISEKARDRALHAMLPDLRAAVDQLAETLDRKVKTEAGFAAIVGLCGPIGGEEGDRGQPLP